MKIKIFLLALVMLSGIALLSFSFIFNEKTLESVSVSSPLMVEEPVLEPEPYPSVELSPEAPLAPPIEHSAPLIAIPEMLSASPLEQEETISAKYIVDLVNDIIQKLIGLVMSGGGAVLMIIEIKKKKKELEEKKKVLV